jgi:hypothetical protein
MWEHQNIPNKPITILMTDLNLTKLPARALHQISFHTFFSQCKMPTGIHNKEVFKTIQEMPPALAV